MPPLLTGISVNKTDDPFTDSRFPCTNRLTIQGKDSVVRQGLSLSSTASSRGPPTARGPHDAPAKAGSADL